MTGSRPRLPLSVITLCCFQDKILNKISLIGTQCAVHTFLPLRVMQIIFQDIIKCMLKVTFALLAFAN